MKQTLHKYFIPQVENNYKPHILHAKRAVFYSAVFVIMKIIVLGFVVVMPSQILVAADALNIERDRLIQLANELRQTKNVSSLTVTNKLNDSSAMKANDMALHQYFSHTTLDNKGLAYFLKQAGYEYSVAGENLAMGYKDADELFQAWINSPSHYSNIVDLDFSQTGIAIVGGMYNDIPTIYIAQHFGAPKVVKQSTNILSKESEAGSLDVKSLAENQVTPSSSKTEPSAPKTLPQKQVQSVNLEQTAQSEIEQNEIVEKNSILDESIINESQQSDVYEHNTLATYDAEKSKLYWQEINQGMKISAIVHTGGDIENVNVQIKKYNFNLKQNDNGIYAGTITIDETADEFFQVLMPGYVIITDTLGNQITDEINFETIKVYQPSFFEKYIVSKRRLSDIINIFDVTKNIYAGFMVFFGMALMINVFVQIRQQHYPTIFRTCGLLALLFLLYIF